MTATDCPTTPTLDALRAALATMPPVQAMGVGVRSWNDQRLRLCAPLERNVNDKGCAFGGSLNGLMTIAAWGLGFVQLQQRSLRADLFVQDSSIRYLAPLFEDLEAEAWLAAGGDWDGFAAQRQQRGRARALLQARICSASGQEVASFEGRFVALRSGA